MKKIFLIANFLVIAILTPLHAQESWTEIGLYVFMTGIDGDAGIGNVTTDVDISFSDILDNLDIGGMGFVEHRRGKWVFIGDVAYLKVSADNTTSRTPVTSVTLDAEFSQTLVEGFVGYRVFTRSKGKSQFGIDLLGGARYNKIELELSAEASILGLTTSASRNPDKDWVDGVAVLRAQYDHGNGWGVSAWGDIGEGSDSSSYQLLGVVNYLFENNIKIFCGYRFYHLEYTGDSRGRRLDLDLDYTGPMLGIAYRF